MRDAILANDVTKVPRNGEVGAQVGRGRVRTRHESLQRRAHRAPLLSAPAPEVEVEQSASGSDQGSDERDITSGRSLRTCTTPPSYPGSTGSLFEPLPATTSSSPSVTRFPLAGFAPSSIHWHLRSSGWQHEPSTFANVFMCICDCVSSLV